MSRWFNIAVFMMGMLAAGVSYAASVLRVGLPALPATLDPHLALTRSDHILARELFTGLTTFDPQGKIVPGLAESWTISPDGLVYTFMLRDKLVWSDGQALDAATIVKSIERALDPATNAPFAAQLLLIKNAESFRLGILPPSEKFGLVARDRRTVEFRLSVPSQRFLQILAQPVASPVPLRRIKDLPQAWAAPEAIVGNGAYVLRASPQGYALSKNPRFFAAQSVGVESVDVSVLATVDAAAAALGEGSIDLALGFTSAPRAGRATHLVSVEGDGTDVYQLAINVSSAPFDKREVRHAFGMLIDRFDLIQKLRLINAEPAFSMVAAPPYSPLRAPYARLERADRKVVAEALLLDVDIPTLRSIRFLTPRGATHQAIVEAIATSWRELGFKIDLIAMDEVELEVAILAGDFDIAVNVAWRQANTTDAALFVYGQSAGQFMAIADIETDTDLYASQLRQAEGVLIEDQVSWPVLFYPARVMTRIKLKGLLANAAHVHALRYVTLP
jgi:oligopeptide transport system substrate-binding protein